MLLTNAPDITPQDYCVLGLATCFLKEDGEFHAVEIIEPIPSAALEALLKGIPTSYQIAYATSLEQILTGDDPRIPDVFPAHAQFCDDFTERVTATVRTYKNRPEAMQSLPLGTIYRDFNYSLEKKRVLNATKVVRTEDNIKQHPHTHQKL